MTAETILVALIRVNVVASAAILLVLMLRPFALRHLAARAAYWLWLVVPIAAAGNVLPARERIVAAPPPAIAFTTPEIAADVSASPAAPNGEPATVSAQQRASLPALADWLVAAWLLGAAALLVRSIVTTRRLAADPAVGPALVGVLRPKLVLPADFESRFDAPVSRSSIVNS
jgi:beta-lactamase regulating signal transducer with metallopeptidase domain